MNKWIDTHFYDKNISKEILDKLQILIDNSKDISYDDKLNAFYQIIEKFKTSNKIIIYFLDQIVQTFINNNRDKKQDSNNKNYDSINKLETTDLLYIVYLISQKDENILSMLKEQIIDLQTGFCPQGRTIRLVQIIMPYL